MNGNERFAERIRAEREKRGLSATALANELNIQKTRVSMWETKGIVPRQEMLFKVCGLFNVSVDYILGNDQTVAKNPRNLTISSIQRGLDKLSAPDLEKAQDILKAAFKEAFKGV